MRRANKAIQRERHPILTVKEISQDLSESKIFSQLDLKWGYQQIGLTQDSRGTTTFATHCRFKRLLFGMCSATEKYQHEIQTSLAGTEGQQNISDDIIVHGRNQEEHNLRLEKVVSILGVWFLRLVNYCGRFIPDLATVSEPLRRLTKQETTFEFKVKQKNYLRN